MPAETSTTFWIDCCYCGEEELDSYNHNSPEFDNIFDFESWWIRELRKKGWIVDDNDKENFCPECAVEYQKEMENEN